MRGMLILCYNLKFVGRLPDKHQILYCRMYMFYKDLLEQLTGRLIQHRLGAQTEEADEY